MIFRQALERRSSQSVGLNDPTLLEWLGINVGEINVKGKNGLKEATVFACVKVLVEALGKLPLKVYQDTEGIKKQPGHYLYKLLKLRPNPYMSSADLFRCVETLKNLHGNAYVWPEFHTRGRLAGRIKALYPIAQERMTVYIDNANLLGTENKVWYVVDTGGEKRKLTPDEILHFKSGVTLDGIMGISPLDYLRVLVENGQSGTKYINNFFKQGLSVKGIVHYTGDLNEPAKKKFLAEFESMSSGLKNAHRAWMLPIGYQFQPLSLTMADAQFLENTELTIRQIAASFGIKMHQVNSLDRATHNNAEEQQRQFYTDTLLPILTMYEQEMTYKLFLDEEIENGFYCKFNVDAILRADPKTRMETYRIGIQSGVLTPNEARAKEELEPKEGADELLINGNMMKVTQAGQQYQKGGATNDKQQTPE